jgi:hypothetical protein
LKLFAALRTGYTFQCLFHIPAFTIIRPFHQRHTCQLNFSYFQPISVVKQDLYLNWLCDLPAPTSNQAAQYKPDGAATQVSKTCSQRRWQPLQRGVDQRLIGAVLRVQNDKWQT